MARDSTFPSRYLQREPRHCWRGTWRGKRASKPSSSAEVPMKLAWQNIVHDRGRFSVTVLGVSFAVFLMVFQVSLLIGFLRAASRLIDASDSDFWFTARGG